MHHHFGLHVDGDLIFLHQGRWGRCVTPGLEGLQAPERVRRLDYRRCPHNVQPAPGPTPALTGLVKALAPIPDGGAYWVPAEAMASVSKAFVMCNPVHPVIFPAWHNKVKDLVPQLTLTNIAPLIITDLRPADLPGVGNLLRLPRVRTVLICGRIQPSGVEPISDWKLPSVADWRRVGGAFLHNHILELVEKAKS